jgi:hypothetical protein
MIKNLLQSSMPSKNSTLFWKVPHTLLKLSLLGIWEIQSWLHKNLFTHNDKIHITWFQHNWVFLPNTIPTLKSFNSPPKRHDQICECQRNPHDQYMSMGVWLVTMTLHANLSELGKIEYPVLQRIILQTEPFHQCPGKRQTIEQGKGCLLGCKQRDCVETILATADEVYG